MKHNKKKTQKAKQNKIFFYCDWYPFYLEISRAAVLLASKCNFVIKKMHYGNLCYLVFLKYMYIKILANNL